jgi:hypothetical protein
MILKKKELEIFFKTVFFTLKILTLDPEPHVSFFQ